MIKWKETSEGCRPEWEQVSPESVKLKALWSQWDNLSIRNGVLYRRMESTDGKTITSQLVLPNSLHGEVLTFIHNNPTGGHLGVDRTYASLQTRCYWPGMHDYVKRFCQNCDKCVPRKFPKKLQSAPLQQYVVGAPNERIALDILGPLPRTDRGNKYILVVGCYFTKWIESYALPNQEAETVASVLVEQYICRFGVPRQIHTDQGTNFESRLFQKMCELLWIDKTHTCKMNPKSDGMIERFNQTLEKMLSSFVHSHQRDWDVFLPYLMLAYRSTPQASTKCSPNLLMLGRELNLPVDLIIGQPEPLVLEDAPEYVWDLQERMETAHRVARENLAKSSVRQKSYYDHKAIKRSFEPGQKVWWYNPCRKPGRCPKLQSSWSGPYVIVTRLGDVVYRIRNLRRGKLHVTHVEHLRPYQGGTL